MKKGFHYLGLLFLGAGLFQGSASYGKDGNAAPLDQAKAISPDIESVETCDERVVSWKSKDYASGRFRLVRTHRNGSDQLYVQWIGYPHGVEDWAIGKGVLAATASIAELNEDQAQYEILSMKYFSEKSRVTLKVRVQNDLADPPQKDELIILLGAPGTYSATWTSTVVKFARFPGNRKGL